MKTLFLLLFSINIFSVFAQDNYNLVWSDEFDYSGAPDSTVWNFEQGFARNEELQWYQKENAYCKDGLLIIEAKSEKRDNPIYEECSNDWRRSRRFIECTSSSITTSGKKEFLYGRFEVRLVYLSERVPGLQYGH